MKELVLDSSEVFTLFKTSISDWSSLASVEALLLETFGLGTFAKFTKSTYNSRCGEQERTGHDSGLEIADLNFSSFHVT